jgi:hypothetical protein
MGGGQLGGKVAAGMESMLTAYEPSELRQRRLGVQ